MLNFQEVRMRGLQRMSMINAEAEAPPHQYVVAPIVEQLMSDDYRAGNGALLSPGEANQLALMVTQMAQAMDGLENDKEEAQGLYEQGVELLNEASELITKHQRREKLALVTALAAVAWLALLLVTLALT